MSLPEEETAAEVGTRIHAVAMTRRPSILARGSLIASTALELESDLECESRRADTVHRNTTLS